MHIQPLSRSGCHQPYVCMSIDIPMNMAAADILEAAQPRAFKLQESLSILNASTYIHILTSWSTINTVLIYCLDLYREANEGLP